MKQTGDWCCATSEYDVDHVINAEVENVKDLVKHINDNGSEENRKLVIKAMIETLIEEL